MTGKTALHNIIVSFDEMGLICSNIRYKEFFEYALHFKDIFKDEYDIIKKDLDRLEKLEIANKNNEGLVRENVELINRNLELGKENQELRLFANKLHNTNFVLCGELADAEKYKQAIEILEEKIKTYLVELYSKEYFENNIKGKYSTLGIANRNGQEKALNMVLELLSEVLGNDK